MRSIWLSLYFFLFIFHLTLLVVFKLEIIDLLKNKEQTVNKLVSRK